jgi:hypothetical protein
MKFGDLQQLINEVMEVDPESLHGEFTIHRCTVPRDPVA